jgi:hypothetical protein
MRVAGLTIAALFAVTSVVAVAAEQATFIKKPKVLGTKVSTVTTYEIGGESSSSGPSINCSGTCFSDGGTHYWHCKGTHADVFCHLVCSPPPAHGECLPM